MIFLDNGDMARIDRNAATVFGADGARVERPVRTLSWDPVQAEKGGYKHFMLKEIHEQPRAVQETFGGRVDFERDRVELAELASPRRAWRRSSASTCSPAARPGTPAWWASS